MILKSTGLNLALLATVITALPAQDRATELERVLALGNLTAPPAVHYAGGFADGDGMKAVFYDALPLKGRPTRVFAWLGLPAKRNGKVPGVVLVHGGGGTAFKDWVRKWNDHGFVAISIAVEGQTDQRDATGGNSWQAHEWPGPARSGIYGDSALPLDEQWIYHAVADTVLANSLLRSLPEVNAEKVGVMGISWGGVITSTVIGIDPRFAFAIPTYGCGHLSDADNQYGVALGENESYRNVWDPMVRMDRVKLSVLWLSWPADEHFPLDCLAACYRAAPGPHMVSIIPGMQHGHEAGWNPPDSYAFAGHVAAAGKPWCLQTRVALEAMVAKVEFTSTKPLDGAVLISTVDTGFTGKRKWIETPATLESSDGVWRAVAPLPVGTTAWFINVRSDELTASSDFQETRSTP